VFIVLGGIQIVATALITLCAIRYKDTPCPVHCRASPRPRQPRGRAPQETSLVPGVRPAGRLPSQPHPPGTAEHCARTSRPCAAFLCGHRPRRGREPDVQAFRSRPRPQVAAAAP
jgi:hypothetical protein